MVGEVGMKKTRAVTVAKVPLALTTSPTLAQPHALAQALFPSSAAPRAIASVKHRITKVQGQWGLWPWPLHQ